MAAVDPSERPSSYLMDMDGVLVYEDRLIPGADRFVARLREAGLPFLVTSRAEAERYPYCPSRIVESVADLKV